MLSFTYRLLLSEEVFSVLYLSEKSWQTSISSDQQSQQVGEKVLKTAGQPHLSSLSSHGQNLLQTEECLKDSQIFSSLSPMNLQWHHSPMGLAYQRNTKDRSCSPQTHWTTDIILKTEAANTKQSRGL